MYNDFIIAMSVDDHLNPKKRSKQSIPGKGNDKPAAPENPLPKDEIDKAGKSLFKRSVKKQDFWKPGERVIEE